MMCALWSAPWAPSVTQAGLSRVSGSICINFSVGLCEFVVSDIVVGRVDFFVCGIVACSFAR